MHWRGNLAQSPRSSAPSSKSDDLCCKLHLMYCGVPNPLDSLCREAAAVAQLLHDLAFRVEALSIKALLILKASCVWCRFRGCAGEPIINSSSISILQATWKSATELIKYKKNCNKTDSKLKPPGSRIHFDVLKAVLKTVRKLAGCYSGMVSLQGNKMPHVGSNWDFSLAHQVSQEGTDRPKTCCLICNCHYDIVQLGEESEKCLSRVWQWQETNFLQFWLFVFWVFFPNTGASSRVC